MTAKKTAAKTAAAKQAAQDRANDNLDPNPGEPAKPLTAKAARKVPMYVDSTIHLEGEDKHGKHVPRVITGGRLLDEVQDDLDEKLTDDELDELIALKAIRPATSAEIAAADARSDAAEQAKKDEE